MPNTLPQLSSHALPSLETAQFELERQYEPSIGRYVFLGLFLLAVFFGGALYWSLSSKLDGAVVAPASLVVEWQRKTVEHIDGGIIRSILVTDGEFVEKGQTLVRLDSTEIDVDLTVLGSQLGDLSVRRARLLAQIIAQDRFEEGDVRDQVPTGVARAHWYAAFVTQ